MASRNERKRRAKARHTELQLAVKAAFDHEAREKKAFDDAREAYVAKIGDALRHHRTPSDRAGKVVKGKFVPATYKEPAKRRMVKTSAGLLIERKRTYI